MRMLLTVILVTCSFQHIISYMLVPFWFEFREQLTCTYSLILDGYMYVYSHRWYFIPLLFPGQDLRLF